MAGLITVSTNREVQLRSTKSGALMLFSCSFQELVPNRNGSAGGWRWPIIEIAIASRRCWSLCRNWTIRRPTMAARGSPQSMRRVLHRLAQPGRMVEDNVTLSDVIVSLVKPDGISPRWKPPARRVSDSRRSVAPDRPLTRTVVAATASSSRQAASNRVAILPTGDRGTTPGRLQGGAPLPVPD